MMKIPRSFGTHDGSFHADEVTACSLLLVFNQIDRPQIFRTRDLAILAHCEFVCDVGGTYEPAEKRFDHHQVDYRGPLSSAGMILLDLKERGVIDTHMFDHLNQSLIQGVDAHDNGVARLEAGTTSFSHIVSNFLPIEYSASHDAMNRAFFEAVDFVVGHLERFCARLEYTRACLATVKQKMSDSGPVLIFEESIPWMENFFELGGELHPAQFVIMPSGSHWKLRGIPPSMNERMKVRKPLPLNWAGLLEEELKKESGIDGAVFCHKGRFISIWESKEDAIRALHIALKKGE